MQFLGTHKYPVENAYNVFLQSNGGSSNAFTSGTHTNYYFDILPAYELLMMTHIVSLCSCAVCFDHDECSLVVLMVCSRV
jgi:hypothetical protein